MSAGTTPEPTTGKGCDTCRWLRRSSAGATYNRCGKAGGLYTFEIMNARAAHPACGPARFQGWEPHPMRDPGFLARMFGGGR